LADPGYGVDTTFRQALNDMGLLCVAGATSAAVVWPVHGEDIDGSHRPNLWKGSIACQGVAHRTPTPPARAQPAAASGNDGDRCDQQRNHHRNR
jgi:hypothetical protein